MRMRQNRSCQSSIMERTQRRSNSINPNFYLKRPSIQMHLADIHTASLGNLQRKSLRLKPHQYSYN